MTERDLFDAIGRLPERFRTEAMELPANTADKTALIQAGSSEAIHSTDAAIRQHKTEKPFSGKLRYLAVVASAAACIAGVVGIMHLHGGSDDDIFVAESVVTDVREEAPETETEPVQTTVTSEAEEILTVRTTEKAVTTAKAVTTGKQQGSTAQQTGTTAAAAVQNSRTTVQATAQQTTAATAQRTTAAPRPTTTGTTAAQPCTTTQSATTTVCTTTASRDVDNSLYPGPNYHIILRPVAYFSDDAARLTDAEMTTLNWRGENEIQYLSEIRVTNGTLVDPMTDADIPAGDAAYTIKGAAGHTYFEESDLNTDIDLFVHNSSDVRLPTDKDVSGIIGFRTMTRNIIHVLNHLGNAQPDERDTDIRPYSNPKVTYYMYANSSCSDHQDDPFSGYNLNSVCNDTLVYNKILSPGAGLPSTSSTSTTVTVWGNRENPYTQSSKTGETFYDGVVIEYNVLTGEMRVSQSLQQGEPIPAHPMPN